MSVINLTILTNEALSLIVLALHFSNVNQEVYNSYPDLIRLLVSSRILELVLGLLQAPRKYLRSSLF